MVPGLSDGHFRLGESGSPKRGRKEVCACWARLLVQARSLACWASLVSLRRDNFA